MVQLEFKLALNDGSSGHQRVKKVNVGLLVLGVGRYGGTTEHEHEPSGGKTHPVLLRLGCLASASLGYDTPLGGLLVKVVNELVGTWLQGRHFELHGFATSND